MKTLIKKESSSRIAQETGFAAGAGAKFSHSTRLIGVTSGMQLAIYRNTQPVERLQIFQCRDKVEAFEFSPDEQYVLCALNARSRVEVFCIADPNWKCQIKEGPTGLISSAWTPDSRSILTESDFGIQLSVWSLTDNSQSIITFPKPITKLHSIIAHHNRASSPTYAFSDSQQFLAVVHRMDLQDYIGIYSLHHHPLIEVIKFRSRSADICCIQWLPQDTHIVTIDAAIYYKCCVYSPAGELMIAYEAYQNALGIRSLALGHVSSFSVYHSNTSCNNSIDRQQATTSSLIAIGSFDGCIRCITMFSWQVLLTLPLVHPRDMDIGLIENLDTFVTKVELNRSESKENVNSVGEDEKDDVYISKMVKVLPKSSSDPRSALNTSTLTSGNTSNMSSLKGIGEAGIPSVGVHWMAWSGSNRLLAASEESLSRCIWIWNPLKGVLIDLLVQLEPVSCAAWRPMITPLVITSEEEGKATGSEDRIAEEEIQERSDEDVLAICCTSPYLYLYQPSKGVKRVEIGGANMGTNAAVAFRCVQVEWTKDGQKLLLRGRDSFAVMDVDAILA